MVRGVIDEHAGLRGLYHVASEPISKFELLVLLRDALAQTTVIEPQDEPVLNRALDGALFEQATGIAVAWWEEMSAEYAGEHSPRGARALLDGRESW